MSGTGYLPTQRQALIRPDLYENVFTDVTQPVVYNTDVVKLSSATSVTVDKFLGGVPNQLLRVRVGSGTVIIQHGTTGEGYIVTPTGSNVTLDPDRVYTLTYTTEKYWLIDDGSAGGGGGGVSGSGTPGTIPKWNTSTSLTDSIMSESGTVITVAGSVFADMLEFNQSASVAGGVAQLWWNGTDGTLDLGLKGGNVTLQVGQDSYQRCRNDTGSAMSKGKVVRFSSASGNRPQVVLALADGDPNSVDTLGLTAEAISNAQEGFIITSGLLGGLNTLGITEGAVLWLSPTTSGDWTSTRPVAPDHAVQVGFCIRAHATQGIVYVHVQNGYEIDELHNVKITSVAAYNVLQRNSANTFWENSANINLTGYIYPTVANTYDIGSSSLTWRTGYFGTSVRTPLVYNTGALLTVGTTSAHTLDLQTNSTLQVRIASAGTATFTQPVISGANYGANFGDGYFFANTYSGSDPWFGGYNNNVSSGFRRSMLYMGSSIKLGFTNDAGGYTYTALNGDRSTNKLYIGSDTAASTQFASVTISPLTIFGAATTSRSSVNIPHGTAPTSPTNGDFWSTTSGFYGRVNGTTVGPFAAGWTTQAAVADATGGTVIDSEARTALNSLLAKLRTINIISP